MEVCSWYGQGAVRQNLTKRQIERNLDTNTDDAYEDCDRYAYRNDPSLFKNSKQDIKSRQNLV